MLPGSLVIQVLSTFIACFAELCPQVMTEERRVRQVIRRMIADQLPEQSFEFAEIALLLKREHVEEFDVRRLIAGGDRFGVCLFRFLEVLF